ncbi:MAG TPA: aspartate--tRNA(Asn) ligase [Bacillota bacterium]|nr:aspartate--tRNA(Asn) ligase [Bacillota bacterium]
MEKIYGTCKSVFIEPSDCPKYVDQVVKVNGIIHKIREMSGFSFIILRTKKELIQCVLDPGGYSDTRPCPPVHEGCAVIIQGRAITDPRAVNGFEIRIENLEVLAQPVEPLPVVLNKKRLDLSLDTNLNYRPISLRNPIERAIFKVQEGIVRGFREFLFKQRFTEIRSPKIVFAGAEGGANVFRLDYFGQQVFLAQSPQFYKQMMVGVYERVFEVAPVFRAEKHNTSRHLNEYISMDFEMGFIESFHDIMDMETGALKYIFQLLKTDYQDELNLLGAKIPDFEEIPAIKFKEAKELIANTYHRRITDWNDFDPEEEKLICQYMLERYQSEFVFITHYPSKKRPFYAKDDPADPGYTLSFDLLFRGLEVTTGGQRVHDYHEQVAKMQKRGMNPEEFESYLMIHKYGIPPHGGLGIGLERMTMKVLGLDNVRNACLFPRDMERVTP